MPAFPAKSRVCFLGDSITANGRFVALIKEMYRAHYSQLEVEFFDCGTSGGTAEWLLRTFDSDIAIHNPTHTFIMVGINDSRRDLLSQPRSKERYGALLAAFETWQTNMRELIRRCRDIGAEVTLLSLPPYAEYQPGDTPVLPGAYALTVGYAAATKALAAELGCDFIDVHQHLSEKMQTAGLYEPDRIHPTPQGHYHIAEAIMRRQVRYMQGRATDSYVGHLTGLISQFRSIWAVEYMLIGDDSLTDSERIAFMEKYVAEERWNNPEYADSLKAYFREIAEGYLTRKPMQAELAEELDIRLHSGYTNIPEKRREKPKVLPTESIPYEEKYGAFTLPEGFAAELQGLTISRQARCYAWAEESIVGLYGKTLDFRALAAYCAEHTDKRKYLEPLRENETLIVKDGIVVGVSMPSHGSCGEPDKYFPGDRYCYDSDSDNNGAGYKERNYYKYLVCLPAEHTFW